MNEQNLLLLTGKLRVPHSIPGVISRNALQSRLLRAINQSSMCCIVSAPAGFGKTTIVSETLKLWKHSAAWLQLDAEDNHPAQFWTYATAALQSIYPDVPNYTLSMNSSPESYEPLIRISNALESVSEPFALVLDDFHHITSPTIYQQLEWFINREIPGLRLILVSRLEFPLNLARVQVRHQLEMIGVEDLRFTANETTTFLRQTMAIHADKVVTDQLHQMTEGWPAALHLLALHLRNHPQHVVPQDTNLNRYFDEEVFNPLPADIQGFLLRTSLLRHLEPDLCQAATGVDGRQFLEQLARNQLFVSGLDDEGEHYRYHSLFVEYLQSRLARENPDWIPTTHRRAADYYERHQMIEPAIDHALLSGDIDYTEHLILNIAWTYITLGKRDMVGGWFKKLPSKRIKADPHMSILYAWVLFLQGDFSSSKEYLAVVQAGLSLSPEDLPQHEDEMLGEAHELQALIAHIEGDMNTAIQHAQLALQCLPEEHTFLRGCALGTLGYTQLLEGDVGAAHQIIGNDLSSEFPLHDPLSRLLIECNQANLLVLMGQLHEAEGMFLKLLTTAQSDPSQYQMIAAITQLGLGLLEYAWNRLDQAAEHTRTGLRLGQPWVYMSAVLPSYQTLCRIELARGRLNSAERVLNDLERLIQAGHLTHIEEMLEINRIRLQVAHGNFAPARRWMLRAEPMDDMSNNLTLAVWRYITYAEVMIAQGEAASILDLLTRLNAMCGLLSLEWLRLDIQLMQSIAYWTMGQTESALSLLRAVVIQAEPENHIRLFLDRGPVIETMLQQLELPVQLNDYTHEVLTAFELEHTLVTLTGSDDNPTSKLAQTLSPREREILTLIAQGASNAEIAEHLTITQGTVKTHIKHILRKLDARNRTDAVARARKLSLID